LLVLGLDPQNGTLADHYHEILAEHRQPDPQPVPEELMDRLSVLPSQRVLDAGFWDILADADSEASPAQVRRDLQTQLASLGDAFGRDGGGEEAA